MAEGDVVVLPPEEDTAEEAQLRMALEQSDNEVAEEQAPKSEPKQSEADAKKSESQPDEAKKESDSSEPEAERERDEKGRFLPKDGKVEKGEVQPLEEGKPPVEPAPVEPDKEEARKARAWQKIQQEKLEVRSALAEIRQLKEQLAQQQRVPQQPQARFSSRDYAMAADDFERQAVALMKEGNPDEANQRLELARNSRLAAQQTAQQEQYEAQRTQASTFEREWATNAEVAIQAHPELGDPSTEEAQAMMDLMEREPIFGYIPDGFRKAVRYLEMERSASVSELRAKRIIELEKENKELREKTAISGGGVTHQIGPTDYDNMTLEQQEAFLIRQARQEDFSHSQY